jgi:hypothetical protein
MVKRSETILNTLNSIRPATNQLGDKPRLLLGVHQDKCRFINPRNGKKSRIVDDELVVLDMLLQIKYFHEQGWKIEINGKEYSIDGTGEIKNGPRDFMTYTEKVMRCFILE